MARQGYRQIDRDGRFADSAFAAGHGDKMNAGSRIEYRQLFQPGPMALQFFAIALGRIRIVAGRAKRCLALLFRCFTEAKMNLLHARFG
ncbi:hypothetical protein D3C76_1419670 [compost metagenome]